MRGARSVIGRGKLAAALGGVAHRPVDQFAQPAGLEGLDRGVGGAAGRGDAAAKLGRRLARFGEHARRAEDGLQYQLARRVRSEEHTSELQSLRRISYAVFCLEKQKNKEKTEKSKKPENTQDKANEILVEEQPNNESK